MLFFPPLQGEASRHLPLAPSISKRAVREIYRPTRRVIISWAPCCRDAAASAPPPEQLAESERAPLARPPPAAAAATM